MGKWGLGHFGTTGDPNRQGFDLFYGFNCQVHAHNHYPRFLWRNGTKETLPGNDRTLYGETFSQDRFIEEAIGFIDAHRQDPFFLFMPFTIPHLSIQVPEWAVGWYDQTIEEEAYEHKGYLPHPKPRAGYAAMVTYLDYGVGLIMNKLRSLGLEEETLVIFTSDNRPHQEGGHKADYFDSSGPLRGMKRDLTEGGLRVPTIAWWPGTIKAGGADDAHWYFGDFMATFAQLAKIKAPGDIDSDSFADSLKGTPRANRWKREHEIYWEFYERGSAQAVRFGKWKAIRKPMFTGPIELYDMSNDPGEKSNYAKRRPDLARHAANLLDKMHTPDPNWKVRGRRK